MEKFDIFIKGINPDRIAETENIKAQVTKVLKIHLADLDKLLAQPNGACVRRGVSEDDAKHYQISLAKLGLVSLYQPAKRLSNLELLPTEHEEYSAEEKLICPNCGYEIPSNEDGTKPEKCIECGITITTFIEQKRQNEERDAAIKAKLLASQRIVQQEEAEKQRLLLEKGGLQELHDDTSIKKPLNIKLLAVGSGLLVVAALSAFFELSNSALPTESNPAINSSMRLSTPVETPKISTSSDNQQTLQTNDQTMPVLNDTDTFANAENIEKSPVNNTTSQTIDSNARSFMWGNDITWDAFLAQNSKILLERQLPENAAKLSKYIIADDVYVDTLGVLLRAAQQNKQSKFVDDLLASLETRLASLPAEQQAVYFAQAGNYLVLENSSNLLLVRAEKLLVGLPKPELQLNAVLKLAVIYSKTGNIAIANSYFNKINALLTPITDTDMQVQLRIAVARAYQEINNTPVAVQWLNSTEPHIKQLKTDTLNMLITGYAQCNQWQTVLDVLTQVNDATSYDLWLYQAVITSLKAGFIQNAIELHKSLHEPFYKALTAIFIANYSPSTANDLLTSSEQFLDGQIAASEKAIVASHLASYYGKRKNGEKTATFIAVTKNALDNLSASPEKDDVLHIVTTQYTHGFQIQAANNLLTAIRNTALKTDLNIEINQLSDVSGLLK